MTKRRKGSGATLALVVVCTIIIIMVGIGAFLLMQLVGGQRELQHTSDAGDLNVAKQALIRPNVLLSRSSTVLQNNYGALVSGKPLVVDKVDGNECINLNC